MRLPGGWLGAHGSPVDIANSEELRETARRCMHWARSSMVRARRPPARCGRGGQAVDERDGCREAVSSYHIYALMGSGSRRNVGMTEDPEVRLRQHNRGEVRTTAAGGPYGMIVVREEPTGLEARRS